MELPQIRPGRVQQTGPFPKVVAYFPNSAEANLAVQLLAGLGVPGDRIGVTPPEQIEGGQGMIVSVGCSDPAMVPKVEQLCRRYGARIHRQRN